MQSHRARFGGLEGPQVIHAYQQRSKTKTRTASGEENPSLHAVSSSAVWRSPNSSSLLKAPCPVQEHQSLQHEVAERDLTPEPRSVWKPRGHRSLLEARDFPRTRQLYWKTRVWCRLSADYVYTRPSEGSPRTTIILENKSLKARALRGPPEGSLTAYYVYTPKHKFRGLGVPGKHARAWSK